MNKRILLIQGHPDAAHQHLCVALEQAYREGALQQGHQVRRIHIAALDFPLLTSQEEWEHGPLPASLHTAQDDIVWAEHLVFFFPLWLGDMPALVKGFLEQIARPGFAFAAGEGQMAMRKKALSGRSARIIITMGMPGFVYRWYFLAHSLKSMKRNILGFVGIGPVRDTIVGLAGKLSADQAQRWLARMAALGRAAA
ncbi:NAD(P)H-dependent oxidoreductase [Massilia sp. PAMC28688]|uniref:NAD(P)H-dependent oxidoreductase n=1 Tax=Massilia sp. PAMC28688 TaxID=2861283 RepID=UPI001C63A45B|nr:NAD(P)H-dependent oxidoreductase [Massilia sp. PAMC28688]QYF92980.1 NAD(P)H-dependent oxidoreductase [Massilia sp. PAMC28688]